MDIRSARPDPAFIPLHTLAVRLGLSRAWLKAAAEEGRIPCLRTGRRLMFNQPSVERALLEPAVSRREEVPCACDIPMVVTEDDGEPD